MFIQQLDISAPETSIIILENCVHFYVYGKFRMVQEGMDHHIVSTHLQNCMQCLFQLYYTQWKTFDDERMQCCLHQLAAYALRNIHQPFSILQLLMAFPFELRNQNPLRNALELIMASLNHNYIKVFSEIGGLRDSCKYYILMSCYHLLPDLRTNFLRVLSVSHHSKMCKFPISKLCAWLCLTDIETIKLCKSHGLTVTGSEHVRFFKPDFKSEKICSDMCSIYHDIFEHYELQPFFELGFTGR